MKRLFDILLAVLALMVFAVPFLIVLICVKLTSPGPAFYWSERVGQKNRLFTMPKFRTMVTETPEVATHLLQDPRQYLTPIGSFLRRTSLDELPQLWCILVGKMSVVGPRPALYNQHDLIAMRTRYGIDRCKPGLTGWAQINGRDTIRLEAKVALDREYLQRCSIGFDLQIVLATVRKVVVRDGITH
jgi:O-antigen biosynthesis protein WbqP